MKDPEPLSDQDFTTHLVKSICPRCGHEDQVEWLMPTEFLRVYCDPCAEIAEKEEGEKMELERRAKFLSGMPEMYRHAVESESRPPYSQAAQIALTSKPTTILMVGESGKGKTCAMSCAIQKLNLGYRWTTGQSLKEAWIDSATSEDYDSGIIWDRFGTIPVLAIDDISHVDWSAKFTVAFLQLISTRIDSNLLTLITSQKHLDKLGRKMAEQCGDRDTAVAIYRRIKSGPILG